LADGSLNLTTVRLMAPHPTPDTWREFLRGAAGKSKREVEELIARHAPRPESAPSIRKLPAARAAVPMETAPAGSTGVPGPFALSAAVPTPAAASVSPRRPVETAVAPDRYEIRFTACAATRDKLRLGAPRRPGPQEVRRDGAATGGPWHRTRLAHRAGAGQARGVAARRWALRVRQHGGTPLR
jgi:hypothetical protein